MKMIGQILSSSIVNHWSASNLLIIKRRLLRVMKGRLYKLKLNIEDWLISLKEQRDSLK